MNPHSNDYSETAEPDRPRLRLQTQSRAAVSAPPPIAPVAAPPAPAASASATLPAPEPAAVAPRTNVADALNHAANGTASYVELDYTATAWSYAKVQFVNLLAVAFTAGILFPLAIARSRRHFYSSIELDGSPFEFEVKPGKACFLSLTIFMLAAAALALATLAPFPDAWMAAIALGGAAAVTVPVLARELVRSGIDGLSYRGVAFRFTGDAMGAFVNYCGLPLAACAAIVGISFASGRIASVGSLFFWFSLIAYAHRSYAFKHLSFGSRAIRFSGNFKEAQKIYKTPLLFWGLFHAAIAGAMWGMVHYGFLTAQDLELLAGENEEAIADNRKLAALVAGTLAIEGLWLWWSQIYIKTRTRSYYLERAELEGATLLDAFTVRGVVALRLSNMALRIVSLGLLTPWTVVREHRYFIRNVAIIGSSATINRLCRLAGNNGSNGAIHEGLKGLN